MAKDLAPRDRVLVKAGEARVIHTHKLNHERFVYNFTVSDLNNYFVGESGVWVHNELTKDRGNARDRQGEKNRVSRLLAQLPRSGIQIRTKITKKGVNKTEILFASRNDAMNWGRQQLGDGAKRTYNERGQWNGWVNDAGDSVYWNHGDWGQGVGTSTFPHLNYRIGQQQGHLYLGDKINNTGMWDEFAEEFEL